MSKLIKIINEEIESRFNEKKPINDILYHGSNWIFDEFDVNKIGRNSDPGYFSKGFYFTNNESLAAYYGIYIYKCEISLSNPLYVESCNRYEFKRRLGLSDNTTPEEITKLLIKRGFDGVVVLDPFDGDLTECVVYNPQNIKIIEIKENKQ